MRAYCHLWISVHSLVENVRWTKGWNIMPTSDSVSRCSRAPSNTRRHAIALLGTAVSICHAAFNAATRPPGKVVRVKPGQLVPGRVQSDRPGRYACDCTACQHVRSALHVRRICNSHLAQRLGQAIHLQRTSIRCEDALPHLSLLFIRLFASSSTWLDLATPLHVDAEWYSSSVISFQRLSTRSDTGLPIQISHR